MAKTYEEVKEYYGKILNSSSDLKTSACCIGDYIPPFHKSILKIISPEILDTFYGCGSPIPQALADLTVLDLGSGSGRDAYLLSYLVGKDGFVHGVDMTEEQLNIATKHIPTQTEVFGYTKPNISFHKGYIENLLDAGIKDNSIDLVISNCVINLSPDKPSVFQEIFRVLKPGGEMFISDVFSDRRIPAHLQSDPLLYGECLSGAMYIEDFRRLLKKMNCLDFREMNSRLLDIENKEIEEKLENINFYSKTIRAFKLDLEDLCEDYGQVAIYTGGISESSNYFILDDHHIFYKDKPELVCGNTADMLSKTRFSKYFTILGNKSKHFGLFDCSSDPKNDSLLAAKCC